MNYLRFLAKSPYLLSFGFGLNFFSSLGQTFYVSLFNDSIMSALEISHGELATIYGLATIFGSFCMLSLGWLLDWVDLRIFVVCTSLLVSLGCWTLSLANGVLMVFFSIFLLRFSAQGLLGLCSQVSMARYFDSQRGKAASVANAGFAFGFAVFPLVGAWLLANFDWRDIWRFSALFVLIVVIPLALFQLRGHTERHRDYKNKLGQESDALSKGPSKHWPLMKVIRDIRFWLIQPAILAVPTIIFSIQFHQLFILETKSWPMNLYASSYILYSLMLLVATILGGLFIDRFGSLKLLDIYMWPLLPVLLVLALFDHQFIIFLLMALSGFSFGLGLVAYVTIWAELYGTRHMGAIRSFNVFLNVFFASSIMVLTGWLIDKGFSITAMSFGGMVFIILAAFLLLISKKINQNNTI